MAFKSMLFLNQLWNVQICLECMCWCTPKIHLCTILSVLIHNSTFAPMCCFHVASFLFGSPVVTWTWYIGDELRTVKHFSQGTLQNLVDHTLLHVHQDCLLIQIHMRVWNMIQLPLYHIVTFVILYGHWMLKLSRQNQRLNTIAMFNGKTYPGLQMLDPPTNSTACITFPTQ